MQISARYLAIIGAISLSGAMGGIVLGNYAASGERSSGLDELAGFVPPGAGEDISSDSVYDGDLGSRSGPTSYQCDGCDAQLHPARDPIEQFEAPALDMIPPYEVYDPPEPVRRPPVAPSLPALRAAA